MEKEQGSIMANDKELYAQYLAEQKPSSDEDLFAQYQAELAGEPSNEQIQIEEEMHPAVSWGDRAKVKNFGTPEGSLKYLKEKYPNLEVRQYGDRVLFKGANEDKYKVLDPDADGFDGFGELGMDLSDVVVDAGQGIVEGAATAAGAVAAGAGTAGAGALAGGIAAGGLAGGALETAKQAIGKDILGVRDEMSLKDIGTSTAFGAVSPLMFGTGAGLKAGAKQGFKELGKGSLRSKLGNTLSNVGTGLGNAAVPLAEKGAFGIAGRAASDVVVPHLAEFTTGIKANVWRRFKDNPEAIAEMDNASFRDIGVETFDQIGSSLKKLKDDVSEQFNQLEAEGHLIDLGDIQSSLKADYEELLTSGDTMGEAVGKKMKQLYDDNFTKYGEDIDASVMGFKEAQKIKKRMAQSARFDQNKAGLTSRAGAIEEEVARAGDNYYSMINDAWDDTLEGFGDLRKQYADVMDMEDVIGSYKSGKGVGRRFKEKAVRAMMGLDSASPEKIAKSTELLEIAKRLGVDDIAERAELMGTYKALKDPSFLPVSGTATSTSRTMSNMSLGALTNANPAVSAGVGMVGLGPSMMKRYMSGGSKASDFIRKAGGKSRLNRNQWSNMLKNTVQGNNEDKR